MIKILLAAAVALSATAAHASTKEITCSSIETGSEYPRTHTIIYNDSASHIEYHWNGKNASDQRNVTMSDDGSFKVWDLKNTRKSFHKITITPTYMTFNVKEGDRYLSPVNFIIDRTTLEFKETYGTMIVNTGFCVIKNIVRNTAF